MPKHILALSKPVTYHPYLLCWKLQRWPASPLLHSLRLPPGPIQLTCQMRCSLCKVEMNAALEQLLMTKATMDSCWRELALNTDIAMCQNEVQAAKAIREAEMYQKEAEFHCAATIKEAEACHAIHDCALQQSHKESILELEHEAIAEEGQNHWVFMEACGAVLWVYPPKACWVLMYPLLLLTGNMELASILGMLATTLQLATVGRAMTSTASQPTVSEMPASPTRTRMVAPLAWLGGNHAKTRWRGNCGARHHSQRVAPLKAGSPGEASQGHLPGSFWEGLWSHWASRWVYFKMHHPNYDHEGSHDLSHTFKKMATFVSLMDSDVHEVQRCELAKRTSRLLTTWQKVPQRTSILLGGASHKITQDHRPKGIHSPKALR